MSLGLFCQNKKVCANFDDVIGFATISPENTKSLIKRIGTNDFNSVNWRN